MHPAARGRIDMPLPAGPESSETDLCIKLPWKRIIENCAARSEADPPIDWNAGKTASNIKWEMSGWYGTLAAEDLVATTDFGYSDACVTVADVMPGNGDDGVMYTLEATNGGICAFKQQVTSDCLKVKASGAATATQWRAISSDYANCQALYGNQTSCEAELKDNGQRKCYWKNGTGPECIAVDKYGDNDSDGTVGAFDYGMVKFQWAMPADPLNP